MLTRLLARPILLAVTAGLLIILGYVLISQLTSGNRAKVEAKLSRNQGTAAVESGRDAVNTVGEQQAAAEQVHEIGKENADAIRKAPGADASVDPASRIAILRSLCRRSVNRERSECVQFAPAK